MALPAELGTEPEEFVYFNAPFIKDQTTHVRLTNRGTGRIGWIFKSTNLSRFEVNPTCGALPPGDAATLAITCKPFSHDKHAPSDRMTIEWVEAPMSGVFSRDWFHASTVVRRKALPVKYNL